MTDLQTKRLENEKVSSAPKQEVGVNAAGISTSVEQNLVAVQVNSTGALENLGGMEGNEIREQEQAAVAENKSDSRTQQVVATTGSAQQAAVTTATAVIIPDATPPVMVRTIKGAIVQEIDTLKKEVNKLKQNTLRFAHELSDAYQKLRNLRNLLREMLNFTMDFLKMLYTKVMKKEALAAVQYIPSV